MEPTIIRCEGCGALNRVSAGRLQAGKAPVCGQCHAVLPVPVPAAPLKVTDANFDTLVEGAAGPVFVDFWAGWCGPCLMIGPFIDQLAAELAGRVVVGKLNVDENPRTAARYGVSSIPTMIIFDQGREVGRLNGAVPKEAMIARLRALGLL
jgi:thioredoxin 2